MPISFDAPLSGMRAVLTRQDVVAHNVANVNTPGFEQVTPYQTSVAPEGTRNSHLARTPNAETAPSNTDLALAAREQAENKAALQADLKVMKAKDRMIGETLDLLG